MASFGTIFRRIPDLSSRSDNKQLPSLRQLNDSVYEFYSPPDGMSVSVEIIFFHGVERGDCSNAYVETWTSFLESTGVCWPQTLLAEQFPRARILSVSYDSSIKKKKGQGNLDLYCTAENLVQDLIDDAKVSANPRVPVVLVGKDFGGLVIKAICMKAKEENRSTFLSNLKGIFYYGTPHVGVKNLSTAFNGASAKRLRFGNKEIARLGSDFSIYRKERNWETRAILSLHTSEKVRELVIQEASQRNDVDRCYTVDKSIDTVCKSEARTSSSFKILTNWISCIQSSPNEGLREGGRGFKTSLDFGHDRNYVPMEKTLAEVKNALQEARIVVLQGGPGSGKSSFARYLALQFEGAVEQEGTGVARTSSVEQSNWLPNGVVYISCGKGVEITSMQRELLRKFNIQVPLLQDKSIVVEGPAELQKMLHQELVEKLAKLQTRVIVVLDDVWERDLVQNLLIPGDWVRYLLTTQISTLWNDGESKRVQMQDVTQEDARHILGNYSNFNGGVISEDLQNLGDEIIAASGSNPLAMATLGIVLNNIGKTVKGWQEVKDNLKKHLETKDHPPSSFGQVYTLSVDASMLVVLDLVDEDEKELLYNICLFDGPFILKTLLQLFLTCMLPRDKEINISKSTMSLVAKGLVRIESETFGGRDTNPISSRAGDDMGVIWIHSLRQHFILTTKTKEISRITNFFDKFWHSKNVDFAIALCALYGVDDIRRKALQKMGSRFIQGETERLAYSLKPFVSLMLSEGDMKSPISQAAIKVFVKYVYKRKLDDDNISYLLEFPSAQLATLLALNEILFIEYYSIEKVKLIDKDHLRFVSVVLSLLDSRHNAHERIVENTASETAEIQLWASRALCNICTKAATEKSTAVLLNVPHVLTVSVGLIQAALQAESAEHSNQLAAHAAGALQNLSYGASDDAILDICKTEGLLAGLVRSLSEHHNPLLQEIAALALANLASDNVDTQLKICSAEGALAGLVRSLSEHHDPSLQKNAAHALANLADGNVDTTLKICNAEGALAGLIKALATHDNHALQEWAAKALANLACSDVAQLTICDAEGALAGLIEALVAYYNPALQAEAARALAMLAWDIDTRLKICNAEGALPGLIEALAARDNHALQRRAAMALANLAVYNVETQLKICNVEGALAGLIEALVAYYNPALQIEAAVALEYLAWDNDDTQLKICYAEGALAGLIEGLAANDNRALQLRAALALFSLANSHLDTQMIIWYAEGALAGLIKALAAYDNFGLQLVAAYTLFVLCFDRLKGGIEEGHSALEALLEVLAAHDNHVVQRMAALALGLVRCCAYNKLIAVVIVALYMSLDSFRPWLQIPFYMIITTSVLYYLIIVMMLLKKRHLRR